MLFHTWEFALFFVVVFGVFAVLRFTPLWMVWLGAASYFFYACWNPFYLALIVYSTWLDFWVVQRMDASDDASSSIWQRRSFWLLVSVVNNLGLLAFFKYADFCLDNVNWVAAQLGAGWRLPPASDLMPFGWRYLLPVGISFYTFQSLSYSIDFYRRRIPRETSFLRFATFVAFFPQLVAGPIERSDNLLPQLAQRPKFCWQNIADGLSLFLVGLFKKAALANYLSNYVDRVYGDPTAFQGSALCLATFCFAWQIYFDFSGYTDMARGVARMLGFRLMLNFHQPYQATGLADFWDRWHISLSTWFRDYVYIPLGGNRGTPWMLYRNLLLVFVISGFWHGSAWQFIVWGLLHGLGLCVMRSFERRDWYQDLVPRFVKQVGVFLFVCLGWVFFRAESMSDAITILRGMTQGLLTDPGCPLLLLMLVAIVWIYQRLCESRWQAALQREAVNIPMALAMLGYLLLCAAGGGEFIYFQF
jgi:D-alanyl-lipoteichoic acid acyltransferase DltB (MBOAT superfamily)